MNLDSPWLLPASGLMIGILLGAIARHYRFCTLTALERHWYAEDSNGLRSWVLAATIAIIATQGAIYLNIIALDESFYLIPRISIIGSIGGGILFGVGMALVGTCGFGALVRIGGGSLQSLVVVVGIGLAALSAQRGVLSIARESLIEPLALDMSTMGSQSIPSIVSSFAGPTLYWPTVLVCISLLLVWLFKDSRFRNSSKAILSGFLIGLCVALGWFATFLLSQHSYDLVQLESASFVLPPGQLVQTIISGTAPIPDYGVGLVVGVVTGALLTALWHRDIRWEACDDARELRRHLGGALLMGAGGVLAAGCTLGQGVSAASVLALSAPVVFLSICLGARIGLSWLLEGSPFSFLGWQQDSQ
ncbi:MAG: hypothetical protein ACI9XK_003109 [Granulosicoccus sp.]|jgi:hypothetical protein